jgi:aryl-alcohol dehydrogenase-like predicted oxidoreductase
MGSVIFGATNSSQLEKILDGLDIKLNNEINSDIKELNKKYPMTF